MLAGQAIRAVALGVVVTAFVQAGLGGIGLAVAGVPLASFLTALMFVLAVAQIGAGPVLLLAVAWLYWTGDPWTATTFLVWALFVTSIGVAPKRARTRSMRSTTSSARFTSSDSLGLMQSQE